MLYQECKRPRQGSLVKLVLVIFGLAAGSAVAPAQQVTTLIQFTNVWKYDQSGRELGTAWRTNDYDDSAWAAGVGLLGFEPDTPQVYAVHAPISTPLTTSSTVITFYFRTTFEFPGTTTGVGLFATNLLDDGVVIYLNGIEAGRVRVQPNQSATTTATGGGLEGQFDVVSLNAAGSLRQGTNLLAVEVHQSSAGSSDVMWGMKLAAVGQIPIAITNQPQGRTLIVGESATFSVGVSGWPAFYQWQKDGVNITGATASTYSIAEAQLAMAGDYRVVVSNAMNSVTSSPVKLIVLPDVVGPTLVSAVVRETGQTNQIIIFFNERLQSGLMANSPTTNIANYRITRCGTDNAVVISNATHGGTQVQLRVGGPNWVYLDCYQLTVNNVRDPYGNRIAPDSRIPITWPVQVETVIPETTWSFHSSATIDPGVYDENWTGTNFVESFWWAQGTGIFYGGPTPTSLCLGDVLTLAGFQPEPMLFRTKFQWPSGLSSTAQLRTRFLVDDGMALYLNGSEIWRTNMTAEIRPLSAATRATVNVTSPRCATNVITATNLVAGLNHLAVGVVQSANANSDSLFAMTMTATGTTIEPPVVSPIPTLNVSPHGTDAIRLSWTGGGYALESATNLTDNAASYPNGPWQQVTNMSNPYTNQLADPARFFRLKR